MASDVLIESLARWESMGVPMRDVASLQPWDRNPRNNKAAIPRVIESLKKFGWTNPILYREDNGEVVAGHTRLSAAIELGLTRVPALPLAHDAKTAHLYAIADNRLNELADWTPNVAELLAEFELDDVAIAGFELPEKWLRQEFGAYFDVPAALRPVIERPAVDDVMPEPPKVPVTKLGDVWKLGRHTLICGSSVGDPLYAVGSADIMVTDPPYGVSYEAVALDRDRRFNRKSARDGKSKIQNDTASPEALRALWGAAFRNARSILKPGAAFYMTAPSGMDLTEAWIGAMRDASIAYRQLLMWSKDSFVVGMADYHYQFEPIYYGWIEGAAHHRLQVRTESTVWNIPRPKRADLHPTMKPVELYARALRNSSNPGAVLYEPFGGSGTGIMAAEENDRTCIAVELEPAYCDVILERWQQVTGGSATR